MNKKLILFLILGIYFVSFVSAVCTVTFDKTFPDPYFPSSTITAAMSCSENGEKNTAYILNWTNSTGQAELDTGTTPSVAGTKFYQTFVIPSAYTGNMTANLTGTGLEGRAVANVSGVNVNSLIISDASFSSSAYVGELFSMVFTVKDENGKRIDGADCVVYSTDNTGAPLQTGGRVTTKDGRGMVDAILDTIHNEGQEYIARVRCSCGPANTSVGCTDENGLSIGASSGSNSYPFTVQTWLNVNTVTGKSNYIAKEEIFICVNLTNPTYSSRIPVHIQYQIRCSSGIDNNDDLDRALILGDGETGDERGISVGTTQMQCKRFVVPEPRYLQGKSSQCYASTNTWVLDNNHKEILGYATTSPVFNITISDLQIQADWQRVNEYQFGSTINLSADSFSDYSGIGISNLDVALDRVIASVKSTEQNVLPELEFNNFLLSRYIKNLTTTYCNGTTVSSGLEINDDGNMELEIRDVDISPTGCYDVVLNLNSFEERQSSALEGIENKTGTFHLDVNCPSIGTIGSDMSCIITAYVEDSQTVQKEVDFTCYISDGISQYSSVNFNQMITRNALSMSRSFAIPSSFSSGTQYVLQCTADYYNLGSRRDSFYDTFTASTTSGGGSSGGGGIANDTKKGPGITGGAVDEGEPGVSPPDIDEFNPFSPNRNWAFMFVELIILIGIIILFYLFIQRRKRNCYHHDKSNWKETIKKIFAVILILLVIFAIGVGICYGYSFVKNSFSEETGIEQTAISQIGETSQILLQGNLIKSIFIIFIAILIISLIIILFTVILLWTIFKLLNVRGEIKFGHDYSTRAFHEDLKSTKLQQKLNQVMLKNEIKKETTKEDYKVRKMTQQEFADFINRKNQTS